jgi:hypothetical protein
MIPLKYDINIKYFNGILLLCSFLGIISVVNSQPWQQNDLIFNPSGIPSLSFSQPRFSDIDADGDYDLILGNVDDYPYYFQNIGTPANPAFQAGPAIFSSVSFLDAEMGVLADLDNDADLDFICGGFTGLNFYENIGDSAYPQFQKINSFFQGLTTGSNPVPTLADLDADADLDLLTGLSESGVLKFFENTGTVDSAVFLESFAQIWADVGLYAYPYFSDLDNDGDFDLLVGRDGVGFIFYWNIGDSSQWQWQPASSVFSGIAQSTYWNSPCLVDLNNDQKKDLVYGTAAGPLNYYLNTGTVISPLWTAQSAPFGGVLDVGGASSPSLFDFDYDGDLDLLSGSQLGSIKYFENIGTSSGPAWLEKNSYFSSISHSIYSAVTAGDVNGDSLPDVITGDLNGGLFFHLNTGTGFIYQSTVFSGIDIGDWSAPVLSDMDNDVDLDIIAGNEDGNLFYLENIGTPDSASWLLISGYFGSIDVGTNCVPAAGDLDHDGDIDIITGDLFGEIQYFKNEAGSWIEDPATVMGLSGGQNTAPALGDLDNDGDLDLILGNYSGTFNYFQNNNPALQMEAGTIIFPVKPVLFQNYPNPFNPTTTILFELPTSCEVTLKIFNTLGQEVTTLVSGELAAGSYTYYWNARGMASGIYLYRLVAKPSIAGGTGNFVEISKMILMK